jgi:hypothetical protein
LSVRHFSARPASDWIREIERRAVRGGAGGPLPSRCARRVKQLSIPIDPSIIVRSRKGPRAEAESSSLLTIVQITMRFPSRGYFASISSVLQAGILGCNRDASLGRYCSLITDKVTMLFFFSYARADLTPFLQRFYEDLREAVRSKVGETDADNVAFRDAKSIEPGRPWPKEITESLRVCKVFVFLHTPTYYTRDGCGKEFRVIIERIAASDQNAKNPAQVSCVQPIYWDGDKQLFNVPRDIAAIQLLHEDYGQDYNRPGMLHLTRASPGKKEYWDAVNAIALRIATAAQKTPLPELPDVPNWDNIKPLFPIPAQRQSAPDFATNKPTRPPRHARFVWIVGRREELTETTSLECYDPHGSAEDWQPFLPDTSEPGRLIAADVLREVKLTYIGEQEVPQNQQDLENMIAKAAKAHTPIVVVTDLWSLHLNKYSLDEHI